LFCGGWNVLSCAVDQSPYLAHYPSSTICVGVHVAWV
jgi:hypothetical protein